MNNHHFTQNIVSNSTIDPYDQQFNILCIGQIYSGKSTFLENITGEKNPEEFYRIYSKCFNKRIVYFHELSEEQGIYLSVQYDLVFFFVDLKHNWKTQDHILKWLELYSQNSGINIFKIPIYVIVRNSYPSKKSEAEKRSLERQLSSIITEEQIIYFDADSGQNKLSDYLEGWLQQKRLGIKCSNYTYWKIFGITQYLTSFYKYMKLTWHRYKEIFSRMRGKLNERKLKSK